VGIFARVVLNLVCYFVIYGGKLSRLHQFFDSSNAVILSGSYYELCCRRPF